MSAVKPCTQHSPQKVAHPIKHNGPYRSALLHAVPCQKLCIFQQRVRHDEKQRVEMQQRHLRIVIWYKRSAKAVERVEVQNEIVRKADKCVEWEYDGGEAVDDSLNGAGSAASTPVWADGKGEKSVQETETGVPGAVEVSMER